MDAKVISYPYPASLQLTLRSLLESIEPARCHNKVIYPTPKAKNEMEGIAT